MTLELLFERVSNIIVKDKVTVRASIARQRNGARGAPFLNVDSYFVSRLGSGIFSLQRVTARPMSLRARSTGTVLPFPTNGITSLPSHDT